MIDRLLKALGYSVTKPEDLDGTKVTITLPNGRRLTYVINLEPDDGTTSRIDLDR